MPPWWEGDRGWGGDDGWGAFPRRRRSRVLQWTGIVVAAALVLGSAGTFIEVMLRGSPRTVLPTDDALVVPVPGGGLRVDVTFEVTNPTGSAVAPDCTVAVWQGDLLLWGRSAVTVRSVPGGAVESRVVPATLRSAPPKGSRAEVTCQS
jgi:hypothetical protein